MEKKIVDVAVIGSGIGGLCLAARLSHAGYKTIVLERMPLIGGRFPFVDYKGYRIPLGALTLYYGERDPAILTLRDVGDETDFEMRSMPPPDWRIGGKDHRMPGKGMLWHLIALTSRDKAEEQRVVDAVRRAFRWKVPSDSISFDEWLRGLTDNRGIWSIFQAWCVQIVGMNLWECTAGDLVRCFINFAGAQQLIPKGGLTSIVDALARAIREKGGEILTSVEAESIAIKDGMARGVKASGHDLELDIEAQVVVSNAGPRKTVELAGPDNFDRGYLEDLKEIRPLPGFWFMVSSNGPLYEWPGGLYAPESRRWQLCVDYTLRCPELAPGGKNWMGFYQAPGNGLLYDPMKEYKLFMDDLADLFPDYKKLGAEVLLARHFTSEWPCVRSWPSHDRHQKTPVENLYNVGDAVNPPEWMAGSGAAMTAKLVAEDIKARIKT
ncbi:phytoene desaturase family protein [Chloroflexota bacterium]